MQPLRAGADRAKRATVGSRCSRVARQHRWGVRHGKTGFGVSSEASSVKGCAVPIGEGSDGGGE